MDASSIISPTRLNQKARAIFSRVASSEDQVVWRPRPEGGRPVRARQTRALALVTDHPVAEDFLDGRSSRYNARTAFSAVSKPCAGLHADQQIEDASRSASQMLRESFSASTLSWHQKCKPPPMIAVVERPQTVQYLRDFEVGSRRRPRTHQGSQRNRSQSFQSLQRRHREFIATEVLATHKYAEMRGENTSLSDIFTAHGLLQEDADMLQQPPSRGGSEGEIDPSEDLMLEDQLDYDPSLDLTAQGNGHAQGFDSSKSGALLLDAPQNNPASEDMDDVDDQLITDPATIRKLRIESEREYQRRRAQEIRQERARNQHRRWVAQDQAEELRRQSRERRDAKWQAERSVHKALQAVEKEARAKTVQSMKDAKRSLQARRQREADAWHKEQAQRVTDLRQHRRQVRSQALSSPQGGVRSPIKLKESTITAQDFLGPTGAHDLLQSSMLASSKEFPPAHQSNREILGGGFNRAAGVDRTWQRHLVHDRNF